jgi:LysW-gamma-L-lysine carboxypeptidase
MTLVEKLVRCSSLSGEEEAVANLLQDELEQRGFNSHIDEVGNVLGKIGHGAKSIYLVGHMDTVPGDIPVIVKENLLHGRGSVDAKGSLAAFVEAAAKFCDSDSIQITVVGCVDEEAESRGALHILKTHQAADLVIIGEPSGWDAITLGYKGSLSLNYELEQPSHHMGAEEKTPAETAFEFWNGLNSMHFNIGSGFEDLSINLKTLNTSSDGLADKVNMNMNIRTPVGFDFAYFQHLAEDSRGEASLHWSYHIPAILAAKNNELVRAFLGSIRANSAKPRFKRKTGTSDMNLLAQWNCPIIAYGPGDSKLDHTPNEFLNLAEYEKSISVISGALSIIETS